VVGFHFKRKFELQYYRYSIFFLFLSIQMSDCPLKSELEKSCHPHCSNWWKEYEACGKRLLEKQHYNCAPQFFDYIRCVDKCVAPTLWKKLK